MSEMTDFQWQRFVCRTALKHGWQGEEPSVLGTYNAGVLFESAEKFLIAKGILSQNGLINCVEAFQDGWKIRYEGILSQATWANQAAAEAQLDLLIKGYSIMSANGYLNHPGAHR